MCSLDTWHIALAQREKGRRRKRELELELEGKKAAQKERKRQVSKWGSVLRTANRRRKTVLFSLFSSNSKPKPNSKPKLNPNENFT